MGKDNNNDRRKFIKTGIGLGMASIVGAKLTALASVDEKKRNRKSPDSGWQTG